MTECYECSKLAELRAENSQLRVTMEKQAEVLDLQQDLLNELEAEPMVDKCTDHAVDATRYALIDVIGATDAIKWSQEQLENANPALVNALKAHDTRDNGWYLRYDGYMTSKSNYLRISGFKAARALDNRQNLVFVKFMGGKEADCRVYAPKLDVCENLHDSSKETQKPRSREADSGNVSDSDGENLHVEQDSREKLEADVRQKMKAASFGFASFKDVNTVFGWLDRQAAITERGMKACLMKHNDKIAELQATRYDLETRNRKLQAKVDELERERDYWKLHTDCWADKRAELQTDYDALVNKCAELCSLCGFSMVDASGEVIS